MTTEASTPAPVDDPDAKRLVEAVLFASAEPVEESELQARLGPSVHVADVLAELARDYQGRGVRLERVGRAWAFRTAPDLAPHLGPSASRLGASRGRRWKPWP